MRTLNLFLHLACVCWLRAYSQPCQFAQPKDKLRSDIIEGFVFQAEKAGFISKDKGFVSLTEWTNTLGREVWSMSPVRMATYSEDAWLPRKYYNIKGYIVMVWEEEYKDLPIIAAQRKQLYRCLLSLVADRIAPALQPKQYWELEIVRTPDGRPVYNKYGYPIRKAKLSIIKPDIRNGSPGTYNYIFGKDGSVKRYVPLG